MPSVSPATSVRPPLATTGSNAGRPTLKLGAQGDHVIALQRQLKAAGQDPGGADGKFGPRTQRAVEGFQKSRGLTADGVVGPKTWGALERTANAPPPSNNPAPVANRPTLKLGAKGQAVRDAQSLLSRAGYGVQVDGVFGRGTEGAVMSFQARNGLQSDGVVGPNTWKKLQSGSVAGPGAAPSGDFRSKILQIARNEIGNVEATNRNDGAVTKYPRYFGRGAEAYCADFVSWVYSHAGKKLNYASAHYLMQSFQRAGKYKGKTQDVKPGDIVWFDRDRSGWMDHVGIVSKVHGDGSFSTIEGDAKNSSGREGVWELRHSRAEAYGFANA